MLPFCASLCFALSQGMVLRRGIGPEGINGLEAVEWIS